MDHADHVELLRDGITVRGGTWADLGAGDGAFTLALAELLGSGATIHAVDRDVGRLETNARRMATAYPDVALRVHRADFASALPFADGSLDGVVMANSLHFVRDKPPVLRRIVATMRPGGRFILVEYGSDHGNPWVPWPLRYERWQRLAAEVGLSRTRRIGEVPSRFLGSIYSAASDLGADPDLPRTSTRSPAA